VKLTTPSSRTWHADAYSDAIRYRSGLPAKARALAWTYAARAVDARGHRSAAADIASLTYDQIQDWAGIGKRSDVTKYQQLLVDAGWLVIVRAVHRRATVYRLTIPVAAQAAVPVDQAAPEGTTSPPAQGTTDERPAVDDPAQALERELPGGAGSSDVGTTGYLADDPRSSAEGTTVVPFSEVGSSDVGTTVVPTSELLYSSENSPHHQRRVSIAYVADRLKIDDDDAAAVIRKIKSTAREPIRSLMAYLRCMSDDDYAEHLADLRDRRLLPSQRGDGGSVLHFPRVVRAADAPDWREIAARQLPGGPVAGARRAELAAAARAAIAPKPAVDDRPAPGHRTGPAPIDIALAELAQLHPPAASPEAPNEEVAA
jgi:hypothetical protein